MEKKLIFTLILTLEVTGVFSLYVLKKEINNESNVYQVIEDKTTNSLTITNPKPEKPTLREIIYYHIIETPYEKEQVNNEHTIVNEHITGNEHNINGNEHNIINVEPNVTDNEHNIIDNEANVIGNEHNIIDNGHNIISNKPITNSERIIIDKPIIVNTSNIDNKRKNDNVIQENKELSFDDSQRHFTNGQGYQYFNNNPENTDNVSDSKDLMNIDTPIDLDPKKAQIIPDKNGENDLAKEITVDPVSPIDDTITDSDSDNPTVPEENIENYLDEVTELTTVTASEADPEPDTDVTAAVVSTEEDLDETGNEGNSNMEQENIEKHEDVEAEKPAVREKRSLKRDGKTYGMTLTGETGVVWNNVNGRKTSYPVGNTYNEIKGSNVDDKPALRARRDDEVINGKINKFRNYLKEAASKGEPKVEKPSVEETSVEEPNIENPSGEKPNVEEPSVEKSSFEESNIEEPSVEQPSVEEPSIEELSVEKPSFKQPNVEGPNIEEPNTVDPNIKDPSIQKPKKEMKTYGMILAGDQGLVWNDLNGHRISYHVGDPTNEAEGTTSENLNSETTINPEIENILNSSEDISKDDDKELNREEKEKDNKDGDNDKTTEGPISTVSPDGDKDSTNNENDNSEIEDEKTAELPEAVQILMKNEQFWKWFNDWSTAYLELLMNHIHTHIKQEVEKQIKEYFATHAQDQTKPEINSNNQDKGTSCDMGNVNGNEDESSAKKRKDKDSEDKNEKKEPPVKIEANNLYGNSVGNRNVTNIFIYNIGKLSDLEYLKPLNNGTNGVYIYGNDDKKPVDVDDESNKVVGNKESDKDQKPDMSINYPPLDHDIIDTAADKDTPKPDAVEENNSDLTTENSKENVISTGDMEKPEDNEIKDTTTEKEILKPDVAVENTPNETTENPNKNKDSDEEINAEKLNESSEDHDIIDKTTDVENDDDQTIENPTENEDTDEEKNTETTDKSLEDNERENTITEKDTPKPDAVIENDYDPAENPKETTETTPSKNEDLKEKEETEADKNKSNEKKESGELKDGKNEEETDNANVEDTKKEIEKRAISRKKLLVPRKRKIRRLL